MKKLFLPLCIALVLLVSACSSKNELNATNLSVGMNAYLAKRGNLCLAKNVWPIDVTQKEIDAGGRNALQMPVLERLGIVQSSVATVTATEDGKSAEIKVRRYALTPKGEQYYVHQPMRSVKSDGDIQVQQGDLCAAKLTLDKVAGWENAPTANGDKMVAVSYTYKADAAPWTSDSEVQKVFPMVDKIVRGAGSMQLKESFKLTPDGWVAVDL